MPYTLVIVFSLFFSCLHGFEDAFPEGFDDVETAEVAPIDLFYNGDYLGRFTADFDDDYLMFEEPREVLEALTFINNSKAVLTTLKKKLNPHTNMVCYESDQRKCSTITPKVLGVILDRNKYQADVYINYNYLKPAILPKIEFMDDSKTPIGAINKTKLFLKSLRSEGNVQSTLTTNNLTSISKGNFNLEAVSTVNANLYGKNESSDNSNPFILQRLIGQYRRKDMLYEFGTLASTGAFMLPSQNFLGATMKTDMSLAKNNNIQYGTPILVSVSELTLVEVFKDNLIIYAKYFSPGNYYLKTNDFPNGAYQIKIRQTNITGRKIERTTLFVKRPDYAPMGSPVYELSAGLMPFEQGTTTLPGYQYQPVASGSIEFRLSPKYELEFDFITDFKYGALASIISHFGRRYQLGIGGVVATDGGVGANLIWAFNYKTLSINALLRYLYDEGDLPESHVHYSGLDMLKQTQWNISTSFNYNNKLGSFTLNCQYDYYKKEPNERSLVASFERPLFQSKDFSGVFSTNFDWNSKGYLFFINLRFTLDGTKSTHKAGFYAERGTETQGIRERFTYEVDYEISDDTEIALSAGIRDNLDNTQTLSYHYHPYQLSLQASRLQTNKAKANYLISGNMSAEFATAYSFGNGVSSTTKVPYTSGLFVNINSAVKNAKFELSIDRDNQQAITANKSYFVSLQPFKTHRLHLSANDDDHMLKLGDFPSSISLYPGNIYPLTVQADEYFILLTTLVDKDGSPIANGKIFRGETEDAETETDEFGEIQLESSQSQAYRVVDEDGKQYTFKVPNVEVEEGVATLECIRCDLAG